MPQSKSDARPGLTLGPAWRPAKSEARPSLRPGQERLPECADRIPRKAKRPKESSTRSGVFFISLQVFRPSGRE